MEAYIVQKESLETVADSIRAKAGISEKLEFPLGWKATVDNISVGSAPDGSAATFGYENGEPVEREEQYAIASADLNELGAVTQKMAGKRALMTVADMIYWLNRVQFIPQGNAESTFNTSDVSFAANAVGILPTVYKGIAKSTFYTSNLTFVSNAV